MQHYKIQRLKHTNKTSTNLRLVSLWVLVFISFNAHVCCCIICVIICIDYVVSTVKVGIVIFALFTLSVKECKKFTLFRCSRPSAVRLNIKLGYKNTFLPLNLKVFLKLKYLSVKIIFYKI